MLCHVENTHENVIVSIIKRRVELPGKIDIRAMAETTKQTLSSKDLLQNSSLYREFQAERDEILRHKWIESEKAGKDIGFERALTDWIIKHRSKWRKSRQAVLQ